MTCLIVVCSTSSDVDLTHLWNSRLGHISEKGMLRKIGLLGSKGTGELDFCDHCIFGNQKRVGFSTAKHSTGGIQDYINFDLWSL